MGEQEKKTKKGYRLFWIKITVIYKIKGDSSSEDQEAPVYNIDANCH